MRFVIIGNPGNRRIELFQAALAGLHLPPAQLIPYAQLIDDQIKLVDVVQHGDIIRIESSGQAWEVERAILHLGAQRVDDGDEDAETYDTLSPEVLDTLVFDNGRIWPQRQWYLGYRALLSDIQRQLANCPPHRLMNHPEDIAMMFDKRRCHALCQHHQIPVPHALPPIQSYDHLITEMHAHGWRRVFIKLAHGSNASGAMAYQIGGQGNNEHRATTTVEMVNIDDQIRLYNSLRPHVYRSQSEIAKLIDLLCRQRVHVEQWVPKAGIDGHTFDLRVLVIAGHAKHTVVRMSRGPMTNLHLGNARGDVERVKQRMGNSVWQAARRTCEQVAAAFPRSLYVGVDLLITTDFKRHAVLEVNAFGDLLPRLLFEGQDTYASEISAVLGRA